MDIATLKQILSAARAALERIEVRGTQNVMTMAGVMQAVDSAMRETEKIEAEEEAGADGVSGV